MKKNFPFFEHEMIIPCRCGKTHHITTQYTLVGWGILNQIPDVLHALNLGRKGLIVYDGNTFSAAGKTVEDLLKQANFAVESCLVEKQSCYQYLEPDEEARSQVGSHLHHHYDFMLAVGSGVINDLVKFISHRTHTPYMVAGTAPSMDGYPSPGAPMLVNGYKVTFDATPPRAIFLDLEVLQNAPLPLIHSGFSDLIGKITANADWVLRHHLFQEYICHYTWDLIKDALEILWKNAEGIGERTPEALYALTVALLNSGFSMALVGDSRPASGAEHLIAHYLEIMSIQQHRPPSLHGLRVGAATVLIKKMYHHFLRDIDHFPWDTIKKNQNRNQVLEKVKSIFGTLYPFIEKEAQQKVFSVISIPEKVNHPFFIATLKKDLNEKLSAIPDPEQTLRRAQAPATFPELGFSPADVRNAILFSRFVRNRLTLLDILDEAGLLNEYMEKVM